MTVETDKIVMVVVLSVRQKDIYKVARTPGLFSPGPLVNTMLDFIYIYQD